MLGYLFGLLVVLIALVVGLDLPLELDSTPGSYTMRLTNSQVTVYSQSEAPTKTQEWRQ